MVVPSCDAFHDADAPVTIATFPNPWEAAMAHAALGSEGVDSIVGTDHGQYPTAASWVQLQVARRDRDLANRLLEEGPLHPSEAPLDTPDDMRSRRLSRRFRIARWFLYAGAVFSFPLPLLMIPLLLAVWSMTEPRRAFGVAFVLQAFMSFVAISTTGIIGLLSLIPLLAFQVAWMSAGSKPPEHLLASPLPEMRVVDIGEEWKAGAEDREPPERPIWVVPILGLVLVVSGVLWFLWFLGSFI